MNIPDLKMVIAGSILILSLALVPGRLFADCSCSKGSNGIYYIGIEHIATTCPSDPPSESQPYTYRQYAVRCPGSTLLNYASYGSITMSPGSLSSYYVSQGQRVLRNSSGTHIVSVGTRFTGTIAGVNFSGLPAGIYTADFDTYCCTLPGNTYSCTSYAPTDNDGDGFTSCTDCDDDDPSKTVGDSCYTSVPEDTIFGQVQVCMIEPSMKGNPINIENGNKYEIAGDIFLPTPHKSGFAFRRFYNSRAAESGTLGYGWRHSYDITLTTGVMLDSISHIRIQDQTGRGRYFIQADDDTWEGVFKEKSYVTAEADTTYTWHKTDGTRLNFSSTGLLQWIEDTHSNRFAMTYDGSSRLSGVTDQASGRAYTIQYNTDSRVQTITGPVTAAVTDGVLATFDYDTSGNLVSATYPDGSGYDYEYTDSNDSHNLTAKKDKAGHLLTSWSYDSQDRATASVSRDGSKTISINYVDASTVELTDAYGTLRTCTFTTFDNHFRRITSVSGPAECPACSGDGPVRYEYDADLNITEKEFANGTINTYGNFDERGNPGTVTLAAGTPDQQQTTYTYHETLSTPLSITRDSVLGTGQKMTVYDYDDDGDTTPNEDPTLLVHKKIETGYTKNAADEIVSYEYITEYTYNTKGQLTGVDGILPGTTDTITYEYDLISGDLLTVTKPLTGTTTFGSYDGQGNPGLMTDVNTRQTAFTYDGRNRLLTTTFEGIHTSRTFTLAGEIDTITAPGSRTLTYTYDPVYGRISRITDNQGSYHYYDYDANGNLIEQSIYNNADIRQKQTRFDYQHPDYPGRLWKIIQPDDSEIIYGYDAVGNVNAIENERLITTTYSYDPLNRLEQVIQPDTIVTDYGYDDQDNLTLVQDPGSNATTYVLDDYGRILSETSPDRGETIYVYDLSSNQVAVTDANGIESVSTYDVLNRLVSVAFPDTSQNLTYEYDTGTDGMGRLTGIADPGGQSTFTYSTYGSIAGQTRMQAGLADAVTSFGYDPLTGDRVSMTYPSGLVLTYQYDSTGRPLQILADGHALVSGIAYMPFGPVKSFSFGEDVITVDRTYTQRYQIERILAGDMDFNYQYYPDGTVQTITGMPSVVTITSSATDLFYQTGSNRLDYSTGTQAKTYTTDNHGNIISDGTLTYIYNQNNRLTEVRNGSTTIAEYVYDAFQRRVKKIASGTTICYHYDDQNRLISEIDGSGNPLRDYIYLGDTPIAMKLYGENAGIYYMVTDHLGTPQQIFDNTGSTVWKAAYLPFGSAQILVETITCNLRFPGQYFDSETVLHYNWHRYYDPSSGRYLTPDPIGLAGGINPFVYTLNNPTNLIDPHGLTGLEATIFIGRGLSLPSQTPYGLAFLGGFGVGMVINHYVPYWGEGRLGMDIYDWLHPTPAFEMARGKQTPRNWATEAARQSAQTNNTDPCDELSKMLDEAKCNGDNQKIRDITQAQKFLKCRNRNKRQNHY